MKNCSIAFSAILSGLLLPATAAFSQSECSIDDIGAIKWNAEIVDAALDQNSIPLGELGSAKILNLEFFWEEQTYSRGSRSLPVYPMGMRVLLDASGFSDAYRQEVTNGVSESKAQVNQCVVRIGSPRNIAISATAERKLEGSFTLPTEIYACLKTKSICTTFKQTCFLGVCTKVPQFYECWLEANTFVASKTLNMETDLNLSVSEGERLSFEGGTEATNISDTDRAIADAFKKFVELLEGVVQIATWNYGFGSFSVPDIKVPDISSISASIPRITKDVDIAQQLDLVRDTARDSLDAEQVEEAIKEELEKQLDSLQFSEDGTGFRVPSIPPASISLEMKLQQPVERASVCSKARIVHQAISLRQRVIESELNPVTSILVEPGDSLWSIAESFYGNGHYSVLLSDLNGLPYSGVVNLVAGQEIKVMPFHEVIKRGRDIVEVDDSLWDIAQQRLGDGGRYRELMGVNPDANSDPNLVYPAQLLSIGGDE